MPLIPVNEKRFCVGQIVRVAGPSFLLATFSTIDKSTHQPSINEIDLDSPVLVVTTLDVSVESGRWKIVGNRTSSPKPLFLEP
ncbi:Imm26 family immunity protein [Sphaerisporangium sp. NPDC051011]|uniref:Imm26 family immunity protein n=1 Tax=Sphaerisporangium sp. NPDC051011 TaxID=3155792 RepID=UPI0033E0CF25